jgi:hypothetical protein
MEYKTKSVIIGRKKGDSENYVCFVNLFEKNDPHFSDLVPTKFMDFNNIVKVSIIGLKVNYFLTGNDLVINDLKSVKIEQKGDTLHVSGVHS